MYKTVLRGYIENLKKEDVIRFIKKNNYQTTEKEIDTIYFYIKKHWEEFYDDKKEIWNQLKKEVNQNLFQKYKNLIK